MNGSEAGRRKVLRERFKADEAINLAWNSQASKAATPRQGSERSRCVWEWGRAGSKEPQTVCSSRAAKHTVAFKVSGTVLKVTSKNV